MSVVYFGGTPVSLPLHYQSKWVTLPSTLISEQAFLPIIYMLVEGLHFMNKMSQSIVSRSICKADSFLVNYPQV